MNIAAIVKNPIFEEMKFLIFIFTSNFPMIWSGWTNIYNTKICVKNQWVSQKYNIYFNHFEKINIKNHLLNE